MNFKFFLILSIYTIWDGLSLKTISRYCPFKCDARLEWNGKGGAERNLIENRYPGPERDYAVRGQSNVWRLPKY
jgi:hypothetical protein